MKRYNPKEIEPKWQNIWQETGIYTVDLHSKKPKYMASGMFNYPSGAGIHIGHGFTFTIPDVKARFKRQMGYESLNPVGWDAFGLPAENYAIKAGVSPQESMATIIPSYRKQYTAMGWGNDWEKEITTSLPEYYKWSQWIFSQMHRNKLAYQDARMQWWCTKCQTVLANEQIDSEGKCWRHDGADDPVVEKKEVKQWFFKITEYADELLEAVDDLDWTSHVKVAQKNWIGRSVGAEVNFKVEGSEESIIVFTTRIDTIFGAAFIVLAPEHELSSQLATQDNKSAVDAYIKASVRKTEVERQASKDKSGVFTGSYAINPANGERIPIWVGDFVLAGYGTAAIMAVPAHDERDFEFANKFGLPIKAVVAEEYTEVANPFVKDAPVVERVAVQVILKHPTEDKYLILKRTGWDDGSHGFVTGGIEDGEDVLEAAQREIAEESGYVTIAEIKELPYTYYASFYHQQKKENRRVEMHTAYAVLKNLDQVERTQEEVDLNTPVWVTADQVAEKIYGEGCKRIFNGFMESGSICYGEEGILVNSGEFTGMKSQEARDKIIDWLAKKDLAEAKVNYKMRDWSVSRQRYWGAPIPIINCAKCGPVLVPDEHLPVVLPELEDFKPSGDGRSALARATDWLKVECPECGGPAERETDTLDTFIDSSWYLYRYIDPRNQQKIFDSELVNKWFPVDFYDGGDHATAHLLYARFVSRFFTKIGLVDEPEPFKKMLFHGKVLASDGSFFSKSKGNGIDPLEVIDSGYGADALRTYLLFAAPPELDARWNPQGVPGAYRFLNRLWNIVQEYTETNDVTLDPKTEQNILAAVNKMVKKVTQDIEHDRYNTAIAALMQGLNDLYKLKVVQFGKSTVWQQALDSMVACVAPFAPHITDELWQDLGHSSSVHKDSWPEWNDKFLLTDMVTIVVQVNGKVRAKIDISSDATEEEVLAAARANKKVAEYISGNPVKKSIYVPAKLVSFVV